jgi:hypothetical protein
VFSFTEVEFTISSSFCVGPDMVAAGASEELIVVEEVEN